MPNKHQNYGQKNISLVAQNQLLMDTESYDRWTYRMLRYGLVCYYSSLVSVSKRPCCMSFKYGNRTYHLLFFVCLLTDSFREIYLESMTSLYRRYLGSFLIIISIYIILFGAFLIPGSSLKLLKIATCLPSKQFKW